MGRTLSLLLTFAIVLSSRTWVFGQETQSQSPFKSQRYLCEVRILQGKQADKDAAVIFRGQKTLRSGQPGTFFVRNLNRPPSAYESAVQVIPQPAKEDTVRVSVFAINTGLRTYTTKAPKIEPKQQQVQLTLKTKETKSELLFEMENEKVWLELKVTVVPALLESHPELISELIKGMSTDDIIVKDNLRQILVQFGKDAVPDLLKALKDGDPMIAGGSAKVLETLATTQTYTAEEAIPALTTAIRSIQPDVSQNASAALRAIIYNVNSDANPYYSPDTAAPPSPRLQPKAIIPVPKQDPKQKPSSLSFRPSITPRASFTGWRNDTGPASVQPTLLPPVAPVPDTTRIKDLPVKPH